MTKLQQIAELKEKLNKLEEDVKRDEEPEFPCVMWHCCVQAPIMMVNSTTGSLIANGRTKKVGFFSDYFDPKYLAPFNGTITYKNGKPVKTEEN